jgi:Chaperone of endosialidase
MRRITVCLSAALLCVLSAPALQAQTPSSSVTVPRLVRVTGTFVPASGQPAAPVETITLAIYGDETGGAPLWQETQNVAVDAEGRYALLLGVTQPEGLPLDVFASGEARWLGRRFERPGEGEQARVLLASVPYALKASDADTLGGRPPSAYLLAAPDERGGAGATRLSAGATRTGAGAATASSLPLSTGAANAGAVNFVGKFVNTTDLGNSAIYDAGGQIGVNTTTPFDILHARFTNTNGALTGFAVQNLGNTATSYSGMLFYDQNGALGQFQGFNNGTHEYRINNIASAGSINFMLGSASKFLIASNGNIGIGTATPGVPLDVVGSSVASIPGAFSYFLGGSATLTTGTNTTWFTSIRTSSGIVAGDGYLTASDGRVKNIQGRSDSTADLRKLLGIEVTDYAFKDVVEKGSRPQKKVIAQQVETVYPQAVRNTTDVVPDIYQKAPIKNGWIELATDLRAGDRVRLITENGHRAVHEVLEVEKDKFRTDFAEDAGQVFVYGREVKDFRVVDYEAIAMLNVSATQELNRRLEQQASELAILREQLAALADAVRTAGPLESTRLTAAK